MTYALEGTAEEAMCALLETTRRAIAALARGDKAEAQHDFIAAMASLVGLYDRQAVLGPVPPERLARFRQESAQLLASSNLVPAYILWTTFLAESANDNQWYELSMRRSAIQSLIDDYPGPPIAELVSKADVEELDDELRRQGESDWQEPVHDDRIPKGLPASHWWWRYPNQFK